MTQDRHHSGRPAKYRYRVCAHWVTVAATFWSLAACSQPPTATAVPDRAPLPAVEASPEAPQEPAEKLLEDGEQIRLERSGCGFVCPSYRLSLYADGTVRYTGRAHTGVIGERSAQIDAPSLKKLSDQLATALPKVAGRYTPGEKGCGQMMTDQATSRLAARIDGRIVGSTRYGGCPDAPRELSRLEKLVDEATRSQQWVSRAPVS